MHALINFDSIFLKRENIKVVVTTKMIPIST
jgi:hypothetical protein